MKNWPFLYKFLKAYSAIGHRLFYRRIVVNNAQNVPPDGPVIFAPNHQNALMDALAVIFTQKRQAVFLARADIFKNPIQAWFLRKVKILPIYRMRDGADSLQQNEEIFRQCAGILEHNGSISLFPETTHTGKRRLQPLKKGIPRIAFLTEEKNHFKLGIKIVPVGIYYSQYENFFTILQVNYGKAINVSSLEQEYLANPKKAMLLLRDMMTESLLPLMIDIRKQEYYHFYENIRDIYDHKYLSDNSMSVNQNNKFLADKKIAAVIDNLPENENDDLRQLVLMTAEYSEGLKKIGLRDWIFDQPQYSLSSLLFQSLSLLLLTPFILYGVICNQFPVYLSERNAGKIKDHQFRSSVKFVMSLIIFPVYYLILIFAISFFTGSVWFYLAFIASLPLSGRLVFYHFIWYRKLMSKFRFYFLMKKQDEQLLKLRSMRISIINRMDQLVRRS
ncbi:MAG: 1-acyl-sn-glycerol-3-phosphate acyltransferase [Bacteroidia bacterium]|nr:1-acyl-sn-glycerol-3-phosphate acyltransferase [Bacteroidia bacterium]